jgi:hypothetical protein
MKLHLTVLIIVYRVYLNPDKRLGLDGGTKVFSEKLVRVVCVASSPRYRPMKYRCPCRVCNHPCSSVAACSYVFRIILHGSTWLFLSHKIALLDSSIRCLLAWHAPPRLSCESVCISVWVTSAKQWLRFLGTKWQIFSLCTVQQTEMAGWLSGCLRNVFLIGDFRTTARLRP